MSTPTQDKERPANTEQLSAMIQPDSINDAERTVNVCFFTGIDVPRSGWDGEYILRFDPAGVDLTRLNSGAPVLDNHDSFSGAAGQKGVVDRAWARDGKYYATLRFSRNVEPLWADIKDRIVQKFSMGTEILEKQQVSKDSERPRVMLAKKWRPYEISVAPIPADFGTTTLAADAVNSGATTPTKGINPMTEPNPLGSAEIKSSSTPRKWGLKLKSQPRSRRMPQPKSRCEVQSSRNWPSDPKLSRFAATTPR